MVLFLRLHGLYWFNLRVEGGKMTVLSSSKKLLSGNFCITKIRDARCLQSQPMLKIYKKLVNSTGA